MEIIAHFHFRQYNISPANAPNNRQPLQLRDIHWGEKITIQLIVCSFIWHISISICDFYTNDAYAHWIGICVN